MIWTSLRPFARLKVFSSFNNYLYLLFTFSRITCETMSFHNSIAFSLCYIIWVSCCHCYSLQRSINRFFPIVFFFSLQNIQNTCESRGTIENQVKYLNKFWKLRFGYNLLTFCKNNHLKRLTGSWMCLWKEFILANLKAILSTNKEQVSVVSPVIIFLSKRYACLKQSFSSSGSFGFCQTFH